VPTPSVHVIVAGDDALARVGLRTAAEAAGLRVVLELASEGLDEGPFERVDAIVWDLGETAGSIERLRAAAAVHPTVAVLWSEEQAAEALAAGARGLVARERLGERLGSAVRAVVDGLVVVDAPLAETVLRPPTPATPDLAEPLTTRETQVLQLVAEGLTNRRIGERLGISEHTAKFHLNGILAKLGAATRTEAVVLAARHGLLML